MKNHFPRTKILPFIIFILLLSNNLGNAQSTKNTVQKYKDLTISIPQTWLRKEKIKGLEVLFMTPRTSKFDLFQENISIRSQPLPNKLKFEAVANNALEQLDGKLENLNVKKMATIIINKKNAYETIYTGSIAVFNSRKDFSFHQIFIKNAKTLYIITFTGELRTLKLYQKQLRHTFDSIVIK